jgi:hypothetical protein
MVRGNSILSHPDIVRMHGFKIIYNVFIVKLTSFALANWQAIITLLVLPSMQPVVKFVLLLTSHLPSCSMLLVITNRRQWS